MDKAKPTYSVVNATKMPGKTSFERNMNAMKEAERLAIENPEIESTYFKFDTSDRNKPLPNDDSSPEEYGPGPIVLD